VGVFKKKNFFSSREKNWQSPLFRSDKTLAEMSSLGQVPTAFGTHGTPWKRNNILKFFFDPSVVRPDSFFARISFATVDRKK
jgi:hypothetical protein